jgi:glycosyltransferase involved in cell wall biosynthesis
MTDAARQYSNPLASSTDAVVAPLGALGRPRSTGGKADSIEEAAPDRRVLIVAPQPFYEDRGTPIAVYNVLQALSQLHYQVDLVTFPVGQDLEIPGVSIFRTANPLGIRRVPIGFSLRKIALDATLVFTMWRRLRSRRYACIHAVEEAAFPAAVLGRMYGVPVIYDMQSSLPEQLVKHPLFRAGFVQRVLRRCERWLLQRVDTVVSSAGLLTRVAADAPETIAREWHFPIHSLSPARGAVDAVRRDLAIPEGARIVLYTGTFEPYQGLPMLLDAIPQVLAEEPRAVFILVGDDGQHAAALREQARALGLNGALKLVGRKPREQMPTYLALADVLVSPRVYGDNLPLKVFDYLAAGRPIVATDMPAHRAVLDERLARLAAPSSDALAQSIIELLTHPARAAEIAESGRTYAMRHFGWQRFVDAVHSVYETVGRRAGARAAV